MADKDVLREFLVSLGFDIDKGQLDKFEVTVNRVSGNVSKLGQQTTAAAKAMTTTAKTVATNTLAIGGAMAAAATAMGAAVVKIASGMDSIYFASQRTKSSVAGMQALQYGIKQLGGSSEGALGSLESLSRFIRNNPGAKDWFGRFGIKTEANGKRREDAEIFLDFAKELRGMDDAHANAYANFVGIDERTLMAIRSGDFEKFVREYRKMAKDTDLDKAAKDAHQFRTQVTQLTEQFKVMGMTVEAQLLDKAGPALAKFQGWFDEHKDEISGALSDIATGFIKVGTEVGPAIQWLVEGYNSLNEATDGLLTKTLAFLAALRLIGGTAAFRALGWVAGRLGPVGIGAMLYSGELNKGEADNGNAGAEKVGPVGAGANDMINFFMDRGWSQAQATGIVANLQQESGLNHKAENKNGMYGLAQWDTKRRAEFKKIMGMDIKESKREHQLAFIQYELTQGKEKAAGDKLRATKTKEEAAMSFSRNYERPGLNEAEKAAEAKKRAAIASKMNYSAPAVQQAPLVKTGPQPTQEMLDRWNADNGNIGGPALVPPAGASSTLNQNREVTVNQTTNITVEGGANASETAQRISSVQGEVNNNLTRNMRGAVVA